jgi:hypothetical protein
MALLLAALTGAAAWMSLARVAATSETHRILVLPSWWWLPPFCAAAVALRMGGGPAASRLLPLALSAFVFLPYLPGPLPAAFLAFDGPVEGFLWAAVAAGVWFTAGTRPLPIVSDPRRAPLAAAIIAATAYAFGWWQVGDLLPGGDEPHYLVITQSILLDGDLRIENNHDRGDYRVYKDQPLKPDFIQRGKDGEIYPMHSPGVSVLVLPAFAAAGYRGAVAAVVTMTAAASALSWQAAWLLTASISGAWFAWAAVFLTTPFFFHGFTIYPDGVGGLFTAAGVWLLLMLEMRKPAATWQVALTGLALSVLPWLHARFALVAGALGIAIALRLWDVRRAAVFLAAPVVVAAGWFTYFYVIWGTPNPSAPQGRDLMLTVDQMRQGGVGILFDQQFGFVSHAPVYLLAAAGFMLLARHHLRLSIELALATVPYVVITASFAAWFGGVSAPARYLATLVPIAIVPIAWWWRDRSSAPTRAFSLLLLLLSAGLIVPKLLVDHGLLAYNDQEGYDFLLDWMGRSVDLGAAFPSVFRDAPATALIDAAVWLAAGALVAFLSSRAAGVSRGAAWTMTSAMAIATMLGAATIVWGRHGVRPIRPSTSQLAMLRAIAPDRRAEALEVRNVARTPHTDGAILRASMLPAGEYEFIADTGVSGQVRAEIGRTDQVTEEGGVLRLPVTVHSVTLRSAGTPVVNPRLRVRRLFPPVVEHAFARRATRYGHTQAYFMDDSSYMERDGFWTRGEETTTIVFVPDRDGDWTLILQSGPVPTAATVSMGEREERLEFAPHQQRPITLPPMPGAPTATPTARVVTIRTEAWFRPGDRDPQNQDTRRLGLFGLVPQ